MPQQEQFLALDVTDEPTIGEEELERIREAKRIYAQKTIPPIFVRPKFWSDNWLEVIGLLTSAAGTILISAMRVGVVLFLAELSLTQLYQQAATNSSWLNFLLNAAPTIAGFSGLFGFETYLFTAGLRQGKKSQRTEISPWGIVMSYIVTISSGLLSSLSLAENADWLHNAVQWVVIASTGIGAPVLAYYGAFNIGVVQNDYAAKVKEVREEYNEAMKSWEASFNRWYGKYATKIWGVDRSGSIRKEKPEKKENEPSIQSLVEAFLEEKGLLPTQVGVQPGDVMSPKDIADALGQSDSGGVRVALSRLRNSM